MISELSYFLRICKVKGELSYVDGAFEFISPTEFRRTPLHVIASTGEGWDHVSVSLISRTPNWKELEYVRSLFFKPSETVMQLHVPKSEHVNFHEFCLHLWRPQEQDIPKPPAWMIGPSSRDRKDSTNGS